MIHKSILSLLIMQLFFLTSCQKKDNKEEYAQLFNRQEHRMEFFEDRVIYNGHEMIFGKSRENKEGIPTSDSILNYKGISICFHTIWDGTILSGASVRFATQDPKVWLMTKIIGPDNEDSEPGPRTIMDQFFRGFANGEKLLKEAYAQMEKNGRYTLNGSNPYNGTPMPPITFVAVYDPFIPDWHDASDAAIIKFNGVYLRFDSSVETLNKALKKQHQKQFELAEINFVKNKEYSRYYSESHTDEVTVHRKSGNLLTIGSGVNYEVHK